MVHQETVLLLLDNYLCSRLPSLFADQMVLTFPEPSGDSILDFLSKEIGIKDPQLFRKKKFLKAMVVIQH